MRGAITGKDVFLHPATIVRLWGVAAYLACVRAVITGNPSTFLGVLFPGPEPFRRGRRGHGRGPHRLDAPSRYSDAHEREVTRGSERPSA
jgi:hypothetical protein